MRTDPVAPAKRMWPKTSNIMPRERLFRTLDELREQPMLWIGGVPGCGRTALVTSYLNARHLKGIWYDIAKEGAVCSRQSLRELYKRVPCPGVLIFDDCHQIAHDAPLHELLADCTADIPRGVSVFLLGRGGPPGVYARLITNRTLRLLDGDALRFTADETCALGAETSADECMLRALHTHCAGWAAGISLTLQRLHQAGADVQSVEQTAREAAFDYFAHEVFDPLTAAERQILVSSVLLPRITAQTAQEVSGNAQAHALLHRMANRQLFTIRSSAAPPSYEYEPLFRQFLLNRLEKSLPSPGFGELAKRAGTILERCGELEAGAALAVRSANWDSLLQLICRHGMRLLARGESSTVQRWINAVPAQIHDREPWLAYWYGAALIASNPVEARAHLELVWERFGQCADHCGQALAAAALLETFQFEWSTLSPAHRWIDRLQASLAAQSTLPSREAELRVYASLLFALASIRPSEQWSARCIERLVELLDAGVDTNLGLLAGRSMLVEYCARLDVGAAADLVKRLRSMLQEEGGTPSARVAALSAVAHALWLECSYSDAEATLREASSIAGRHRLKLTDPLFHRTRHMLAFARGDRAELAACVQDMRQLIDPNRHLGMSLLSHALAGQALLRGEVAAAANHWQSAATQADEAGARPMQWLARLALAGHRAKLGDCAGAAQALQMAQALVEGAIPSPWLRDHELLAAYIALRASDRTECNRRLASALSADQPHSVIASQLFPLLPSHMAELCQQAMHVPGAGESVRALIQRYRIAPPESADRDWPWPFKVCVLGRFRILKDDAPINFSRRVQKKTLELLQALIALGGTDVGAGTLTDALWPDSDGDAGYHALESALYRLRQLLGAHAAVTMVGGKLSLDRRYFWVDMWALERELQRGAPGDESEVRLMRIRQLYQGHFLEQESDKPWALETRQGLRDKFVRAIREVARTYESRGQWQEAAELYQTAIERDGLAEDLYRGLMLCHRALGDHSEAMQVYRRCRELLTRVLGVQPNAKTQAIYNSVRQSQVAQSG